MSRIVDGVIYDTNKNFVVVFKGDPRHALAAANMKLPAEVRADEYIETEHVIILGEMVYRKSNPSGDKVKTFAGLVKSLEDEGVIDKLPPPGSASNRCVRGDSPTCGHIFLLGGRPERDLPIGKDDCINLKIALETSRSLREFLANG